MRLPDGAELGELLVDGEKSVNDGEGGENTGVAAEVVGAVVGTVAGASPVPWSAVPSSSVEARDEPTAESAEGDDTAA